MATISHGAAASFVPAKYNEAGVPEFQASDFKELEARQRGPDVLTAQEMGIVREAKENGNAFFRAGQIKEALTAYNSALQVFADRRGGPDQRGEKSKICANRAECLLRMQHWEAAEKSAAAALMLDANNAKARFRRARALAELGGESRLREALDDLEKLRLASDGSLGKAEATLHKRVLTEQAELKEVRRRDASGLRAAFESGDVGLLSDDELAKAAATSSRATDRRQQQGAGEAAASAWSSWAAQLEAIGCEPPTRYAWIIDVYRTRVDDDSKRGRDHKHGIQAVDLSPPALVLDFLTFCLLCVSRGVITSSAWPGWWQWEALLAQAATMIGKPFEPQICRAELRYGAERGASVRAITHG